MRLERLVVEGFESAADKVEIDFTGKNLTVFVGENGSGKSLLSIWAPIFALYGKTRHRTLDKAIASSRGQAIVELEFSANGGSYKVIRKLPRKGRNEATLYAKDKDGDWEAQTSKDVKTTDPKIIEVIGMDYDAAVATFIAQQGKYGLFNEITSEPRRKILTNLLNLNGYEEFRALADERYKALVVEAATYEAQLEEIVRLRDMSQIGNPEFENVEEEELNEILEGLVETETHRQEQEASERWKQENADQVLRDAQNAVDKFHRDKAEKVNSLRTNVETLESTMNRDRSRFDSLNAEIQRIEEAKVLIVERRNSAKQLENRITKGESLVADLEATVQDLGEQGSATRAEENALKAKQTDLADQLQALDAGMEHGHAECVTCKQSMSKDLYDRVRAQIVADQEETAQSLKSTAMSIATLTKKYTADKNKVNEYKQYLKDYASKLQTERESITRLQGILETEERTRTAIAEGEKALSDTQERITSLTKEIKETDALTVPAELSEAVTEAQKRVQAVKEEAKDSTVLPVVPDHRVRIAAIEKELAHRANVRANEVALDKRKEEVKSSLTTVREDESHYEILRKEFAPTGIPAMILAGCLQEIEDDANEYLDKLSNETLTVNIETQSETKSGKVNEEILITVNAPDGTRDYSSFSGGQKFRIDLAMRAALCKVSARRNGSAAIETLFIDEGFGALDDEGKQSVMEVLADLSEEMSIVAVSHISGVREGFTNTVEVSLETGTTAIKETTVSS